MLFYLMLLFTVVPFIELALLFWLGEHTVWWAPILLVIATGMAGATLWRAQGLRVIQRIKDDMGAGRMPASALVDGLMIFLAGAFLITPGVITDAIGVALLIPPVRAVVKRLATAWFVRHVEVRTATTFGTSGSTTTSTTNPPGGDKIIDARVVGTRVEDA
jgi:UPF0716 protein FxsA